MIEFKKALDLLHLMKDDVPKNQFMRRKRIDKERDEKIKYFTALIVEKKISVSLFLEAMANKTIIPMDDPIDLMDVFGCDDADEEGTASIDVPNKLKRTRFDGVVENEPKKKKSKSKSKN